MYDIFIKTVLEGKDKSAAGVFALIFSTRKEKATWNRTAQTTMLQYNTVAISTSVVCLVYLFFVLFYSL